MKPILFQKFKFFAVIGLSAFIVTIFSFPGSVLAINPDSSNPIVAIDSPTNNSTVTGAIDILASASDAYSSCVVTLFNQDYDVSTLKLTHPGGDIFVCGSDMTDIYQSQHGTDLTRMAPYLIPDSYIGITSVEFYMDNTLLGTSTTSPYIMPWDSTSVTDGSHVLTAKAYDQAGNMATSTPINITVDNSIEVPILNSINVNPNEATLGINEDLQVTAMALDQFGDPLDPQPTFVWGSTNSSVAAVNENGLVTGLSAGNAAITLSTGLMSAIVNITVVDNNIPVLTSIQVTPTSAAIDIGANQQFTAMALDQFGDPLDLQPVISWSVTNNSIASIDANGLVYGLAEGTTTVSAYIGDISSSSTLLVNPMLSSDSRIKVEMENGKAEINAKVNGSHYESKIYATTKEEVIDFIMNMTGLTHDQIVSITQFKIHHESDQGNRHNEEERGNRSGQTSNTHEQNDD